jgi:hypothetical protein
MTVVQPNCRLQFTANDLAFILKVLGTKAGSQEALLRLLADEESRDLILDQEALLRAVLEADGCLPISPQFYFYILVRHVFRQWGIEDRRVADYVAEMLAEFSQIERIRCRLPGGSAPAEYVFEMLAALPDADDTTRFYIRAHVGNYSLFLSGVYPDRIRFQAQRRGGPDLPYYEAVGRMSYRAASGHRLARQYELEAIFDTLSERFHQTRRALNDLSERLLSLGDTEPTLEAFLRRTLAS